jgi:hypothetical protein
MENKYYFVFMLVPSMNYREITQHVKRDRDKIIETTLLRLGQEYDRERRKFKIDKKRTYTRLYTFKTATKNNWMVVLGKSPSREVYLSPDESLTYAAITYFFDTTGLKVFQWTVPGVIQAYNSHFFSRYNERMQLGLNQPLDMVKHYFIHNAHPGYRTVLQERRLHSIGFTTHGLMLGDFWLDEMWVQWRTFVTRDLVRPEQDEIEHQLILQLQGEMMKALKNEKMNIASADHKWNQLTALNGNYDPR